MRVVMKNLQPDTTSVERVCFSHGYFHCRIKFQVTSSMSSAEYQYDR